VLADLPGRRKKQPSAPDDPTAPRESLFCVVDLHAITADHDPTVPRPSSEPMGGGRWAHRHPSDFIGLFFFKETLLGSNEVVRNYRRCMFPNNQTPKLRLRAPPRQHQGLPNKKLEMTVSRAMIIPTGVGGINLIQPRATQESRACGDQMPFEGQTELLEFVNIR